MSQESRGLGQTDIVTVFATRQALTRSSQNSEVGTVLANFIYGEQKNGEAPSLASIFQGQLLARHGIRLYITSVLKSCSKYLLS